MHNEKTWFFLIIKKSYLFLQNNSSFIDEILKL